MPRQRYSRLEPPHLRKIREQGEHAEEAPVGTHRRRRRDAEHALDPLPHPACLAALEGPPVGENPRDEVPQLRSLGEQAVEWLPVRLAGEREDLAPRLIQLDDRARGVDREQARRQIPRKGPRGGLEIVRALLLEARQPLELSLLLRESGDSRFEARDQELPFVADRLPGAGHRARGLEHAIVRSEQRPQIQPRQDHESHAGDRDQNRHEQGEPPQPSARSRIEGDLVRAIAGRKGREEERRAALPLVGDAARRRALHAEEGRSLEAVTRSLYAAPARVVRAEEEDVRFEHRALDRFPGALGAPGEGDAPKDLARAALGHELSPGDRVAKEEQRDEVHEEDQEKRDPQKEAGLTAEGARDVLLHRGPRPGRATEWNGMASMSPCYIVRRG